MKQLEILGVVVATVLLTLVLTSCSYTPPEAVINVYDNSYVCSCYCAPAQRHRDLRISFSEDDAEQQLNGTILLTSPDLDFLNGRYIGLRFGDVGIPQNAGILHAYLQFAVASGSTTGSLTVAIGAVQADDAAPFTTTANSLSALTTGTSVNWPIPNWPTLNAAGSDQLTPDLAGVIQEIVVRSGWVSGNDLALIIKGTSGAAQRKAHSIDGRPDLAAVLSIDYTEPLADVQVLQHLPVCVPQALNANVGGVVPDDAALTADCGDGTLTPGHRVQDTVSGLSLACNYPSLCTCTVLPDSAVYKGSCDADTGSGAGVCTEVELADDCSNFDPPHENVTATNATGGVPVCAANSPLSAEMFGLRSTCEVEGTAPLDVGGHSGNPSATGIVNFKGHPCPGATCDVGVEYRLDIESVTFGNFFHSETFSDLGGLGESLAGSEAALSSTGEGAFATAAVTASGHGRRGGGALKGTNTSNGDQINVTVGWGDDPPMCHLDGTLIGSVDPEAKQCDSGPNAGQPCASDDDCAVDDDACGDAGCHCVSLADVGLTLQVNLDGKLVNQPPTADAGDDEQTIECSTAAVNVVFLDGRGSSDPDGNLVLYSWLRGGRAGVEVGFDPLSKIEQQLGSETYILRVIDGLGQADEDTTTVNVVDTMPPVVSCSVLTPVVNQTNHNLVNVGLAGSAVDQCEGELPVAVKVYADEDDEESTGDGKHSPDAKDLALGTLRLRAERKGGADGRVYLIVTEATDSSGNRGSNCCTATVPYSSAASSQASAAAQASAARSFCLAHGGTAPAGFFTVGDGAVIGPKQ